MVTSELIRRMHCPYCGSGLDIDESAKPAGNAAGPGGGEGIEWGLAACACARYPIVNGILVLEQGALMPRQHLDRSAAALRAGDRHAALGWAVRASDLCRRRPVIAAAMRLARPVLPRLAERYGQRVDPAVLLDERLTFEDLALATRPTLFAHYLVQRFANPSLMDAAALIAAMGRWAAGLSRRPLVIDLGAGAGHASFLMRRFAPGVEVITSDSDVVGLCLARRLLGPGATLIALDAQAPLPFADYALDGVFSLDAFHYMPSKLAVVRELTRALKPGAEGGVWIFPHLHNAAGHNPAPGLPLTLEGYRRIFAPAGPRFFDESDVIRALIRDHRLPSPGEADPASADALCMLGGAAARWTDPDLPDPDPGPLGVNPVYTPAGGREGTRRFVRTWADDGLRRECARAEACFPATIEIRADLLRRAATGVLHDADRAEAERLARSFILVPMPARYRRAGHDGV